MTVIDDHLDRFDGPQHSALTGTVATIRTALPGAAEVLAYGMPTFKAGDATGPAIIGLDGFTRHNSLFPYSTSIASEFAAELADYPQTKGSIHFGIDEAFPAPLLKRVLKARMRDINAGYPKKGGEVKEYYDNGFLKQAGRLDGDTMVGAWRWYRRDGSLMRSGSFRKGEQTGEWITYDRAGDAHKVTRF